MKLFEFAKQEIENMYDDVCVESGNAYLTLAKVARKLDAPNDMEDASTMEDVKNIIEHYTTIRISVCGNMIEVPNNADNVECIFAAIRECRANTL